MCDTWTSEVFSSIPLYLLYIKSSFKDDIYERFRANLFSLRQKATCSNYLPLLHRAGGGGGGGGDVFKFPVCPVRMGAVCPLNLCFTNLTSDSCAALSRPIAHIQCVPVCRGWAEEASAITTICTTLCTSLPALSPVSTSLPSYRLPVHSSRHCNPISFASYLISHAPSPQIVFNSVPIIVPPYNNSCCGLRTASMCFQHKSRGVIKFIYSN